MINLPKWIQRILDESVCPACEAKADKTGVFALGIKEEIHSKTKKSFLSIFFLYNCNKCKKASTFSGLPTSFDDFIENMLEVSNSPTPSTADCQSSDLFEIDEEQGISDKEVQELKKSLKTSKYFEDFLTDIGIDKNDLNKKDDHDDNENK